MFFLKKIQKIKNIQSARRPTFFENSGSIFLLLRWEHVLNCCTKFRSILNWVWIFYFFVKGKRRLSVIHSACDPYLTGSSYRHLHRAGNLISARELSESIDPKKGVIFTEIFPLVGPSKKERNKADYKIPLHIKIPTIVSPALEQVTEFKNSFKYKGKRPWCR